MKSDKLLMILTSTLFLGGALIIGWALYRTNPLKSDSPAPVSMDCVQSTQLHTMRQPDMGTLLEKGQQYKILVGYFDCNPVQRGDLVAFLTPEAERPLVRVVRGLPGDRVEVRSTEGENREVLVNDDTVIATGEQVRWTAPSKAPAISELFEGHEGVLGDDQYLILAVTRLGEADSIALGPSPKSQIMGMISILPPSEP